MKSQKNTTKLSGQDLNFPNELIDDPGCYCCLTCSEQNHIENHRIEPIFYVDVKQYSTSVTVDAYCECSSDLRIYVSTDAL